MSEAKVSICIASYNMGNLIWETIHNCLEQTYKNKEIIIYDDCSTDKTERCFPAPFYMDIKYYRGEKNLGVGSAFNEAIKRATGDIIVLMCADDLFRDKKVIEDMVFIFNNNPDVGHVSRFYHQFVDKDPRPVRAWRTHDPLVQSNNPSGLAFRKKALEGCQCSNHMFIETSFLVKEVLDKEWGYYILPYDAIGARVHKSTSTQKGYWLKRRVSSPIEDWVNLGCTEMLKDFTSFIQIKNGFTTKALLEEIYMFIKLRPLNLLMPGFYFFALVSLLTPRFILRNIPSFYRNRIGRLITKEVKRG